MKYRKRPVVVEAFQMTEKNWREAHKETIPYWFFQAIRDNIACKNGITSDFWGFIETLEGRHKVLWNDYVIKGVKGELYPCKPDIFNMTYEAV